MTGKDEKNERKEVWNRSEQNERNMIFLEGDRIEKERKIKVRKMIELNFLGKICSRIVLQGGNLGVGKKSKH